MSPWISAARPKTLSAGIIPVLVASALAVHDQKFQLFVFLAALLGSIAIQIATNYINDASDFLRGADTEERLGPPRMAQTGAITPRALFWGAALCFLFATLMGVYLIIAAGFAMLWIGVFSILAAIAYTAGPYPLAYYGLGDLFVLIFFGFVAVCGTYFAHSSQLSEVPLWLSLAVGALGVSLIVVNNARDIPTDTKVQKKTMAVRMGLLPTKIYYVCLLAVPYAVLLALHLKFPAGKIIFAPMVTAPMAIRNSYQMFQAQKPMQYNELLAKSAKLQIFFGLLLSLAIVFS